MDETVGRVVVELPEEGIGGRDVEVVLAAALTLFPPSIEIVLFLDGVAQPTQAHADRLLQACQECLPPRAVMPTIDLVGHREALREPHLLHVRAGGSAFDAVRAVVRLAALAKSLGEGEGQPPRRDGSDAPGSGDVREQVARRIRARDLVRSRAAAPDAPLVVAIVQVQSYWPALSSICEALRGDGSVRLEVVALESDHDQRAQSTEEFVRARGYEPRGQEWFAQQLADESGPLSLVLIDNPYDGIRPEGLRSVTIANAGVRQVYSPYTNNNLGSGEHLAEMHHEPAMQYDLPLHRVAWRIYVRSDAQKDLHARYCSAGADNVRVSGMPKLDRLLGAVADPPDPATSPILLAASGRPVVLWNPHFSFGDRGWSTFESYLHPMLEWFSGHPDVVLLMRPHFRIWRDLRRASGGRQHTWEKEVRRAARRRDNILLDEDEDYLPAFLASDAMVSDLSSLITEYVPLGKPVLYLHKDGGPGVNEDAAYFFKLDVATSWEHVAAFLDQMRLRADGGAGRREMLLRHHFGDLDGRAGERIARDVVTSLAAELTALPA